MEGEKSEFIFRPGQTHSSKDLFQWYWPFFILLHYQKMNNMQHNYQDISEVGFNYLWENILYFQLLKGTTGRIKGSLIRLYSKYDMATWLLRIWGYRPFVESEKIHRNKPKSQIVSPSSPGLATGLVFTVFTLFSTGYQIKGTVDDWAGMSFRFSSSFFSFW